jgi:thiamine-monophosphate kinase
MIEDSKELRKLSELGEFGLIEHLTKDISLKHDSTVKGIGDDAAVLNYSGKRTLVTTDLLVEGVHFNLIYTPLKHLGYKSVVVNLSDIYAMNAIPKQITVSLAVSSKFSLDAIEELYDGIKLACELYNVDLVGGDTTSSLTGLVICVTAIGEAEEHSIAYRSGAKVNDLVCVSGDLGAAYMGLQLLEREKALFTENPAIQPDLQGKEYILERQLKPEARKDIIELFAELGIKPTAMIDISDGLSSEILHICQESDMGCCLYEEKIPIDPTTLLMADEFNISGLTAALNGGEDYELLFTIPINQFDLIKNRREFKIIGHITDKSEGVRMQTKAGESITLIAQGWNPLKKESV